ncbi:MAG: SCO family protein [Bdellovibrionales bacterium]|nr:SCO family protein [Bdellovibrionales bacterium]
MEDWLGADFRVMIEPHAAEGNSVSRPTLLLVTIWLIGTMLLWWFAFSGSSNESSDWLTEARSACFGIEGHGLPNGGGWLLLILAPALFLFAICVAFPVELRTSWLSLVRQLSGRIALVAVSVLIGIQVVWAGTEIQKRLDIQNAATLPFQTGEFPENYPPLSKPAPNFSLVNFQGSQVSLSDFRGRSVILTFAFAHCKTVCPTLISSAKSALAQFSTEQVQMVVVTLDPWRDTPAALSAIQKRWNLPNNATVLSGSVDQIKNLLQQYEYPSVRDEKTGDLTHPAFTYVIAPDGFILYTLNNPSAEWLRGALHKTGLSPLSSPPENGIPHEK